MADYVLAFHADCTSDDAANPNAVVAIGAALWSTGGKIRSASFLHMPHAYDFAWDDRTRATWKSYEYMSYLSSIRLDGRHEYRVRHDLNKFIQQALCEHPGLTFVVGRAIDATAVKGFVQAGTSMSPVVLEDAYRGEVGDVDDVIDSISNKYAFDVAPRAECCAHLCAERVAECHIKFLTARMCRDTVE